MKIRNVGITKNVNIETKINKEKLDFSDSFENTNKSKTKEELELYIKDIKKIGERLALTKGYTDVIKYKKVIKEYLKTVVNYVYSINKKSSFWDSNYFTTVKTVNDKLDEITKDLLYNEKDNIDVASKIDDINGLLIDIYM